MKKHNILYWVTTGLFSLMMVATVGNSIFNDQFSSRFESLGYPKYLIVPLMVAKVIGLITIWSDFSHRLSELAYAGFFYLILIALNAEFHAHSPDLISPCLALLFLTGSFYFRFKRPIKLSH